MGNVPPSKASAKTIQVDLEKKRMARRGSLLWWVTAVTSHRMITGTLTVYNCWRPRESWSTNKRRDKQQHADEESTIGVKVFRAQSRLTEKPVQSATTCWTRCILGAGAEVTLVIAAWLADRHQREAETEPHHNLLRGSRAGLSPQSASESILAEHPGWKFVCGRAARVGEPRDLLKEKTAKKWQKYCADTVFTPTPLMTLQSTLWNLEGTNEGSLKDYYSWKKNTVWV